MHCVCTHTCVWYVYASPQNYPSYSTERQKCTKKLIYQRSYTTSRTSMDFSLLLSSPLQVKQNYLFSLLTFSVNSSSTSPSLDLTFPYRRTDVLHQITYPQLATKLKKHLSSEGPTPCVIYKAITALQVSVSTLQKAERNFNLFFSQGKNFYIMSHVA